MSDEPTQSESLFARLSAINVTEHTEKKGKLTYLSWAHAWRIFKTEVPAATYKVFRQNGDGLPYNFDAEAGYMCHTEVTAEGETLEMWLPVMNHSNKALMQGDATMFEVNKTIMRCLVKNLGMFGLGINIYAGEDLPIVDTPPPEPKKKLTPSEAAEAMAAKNADKKWMEISWPWAKPEECAKKPLSDLAANANVDALTKMHDHFGKLITDKTPALVKYVDKIGMALTEAKSTAEFTGDNSDNKGASK